jgi:hypothetical protein
MASGTELTRLTGITAVFREGALDPETGLEYGGAHVALSGLPQVIAFLKSRIEEYSLHELDSDVFSSFITLCEKALTSLEHMKHDVPDGSSESSKLASVESVINSLKEAFVNHQDAVRDIRA